MVVNPEKFRPVNKVSWGTNKLVYLAGEERSYFYGPSTNRIIDSIKNITRSYFELGCHTDRVEGKRSRIELKSKKGNVFLFSPDEVGMNSYENMDENWKKTFALTVATEGILGKMVGKPEKIKYRKSVKKQSNGLFRYNIKLNIPEQLLKYPVDIFVIFKNKKTKKWGVTIKNKMVSKTETLSIVSRGKKENDLYFVLINAETGDSFYNQIK